MKLSAIAAVGILVTAVIAADNLHRRELALHPGDDPGWFERDLPRVSGIVREIATARGLSEAKNSLSWDGDGYAPSHIDIERRRGLIVVIVWQLGPNRSPSKEFTDLRAELREELRREFGSRLQSRKGSGRVIQPAD